MTAVSLLCNFSPQCHLSAETPLAICSPLKSLRLHVPTPGEHRLYILHWTSFLTVSPYHPLWCMSESPCQCEREKAKWIRLHLTDFLYCMRPTGDQCRLSWVVTASRTWHTSSASTQQFLCPYTNFATRHPRRGNTAVSDFMNLDVRDLVILWSLISMPLLRPFVTGSDKSRWDQVSAKAA
jgi:hypothetical protein